jgi:hypothetical protein
MAKKPPAEEGRSRGRDAFLAQLRTGADWSTSASSYEIKWSDAVAQLTAPTPARRTRKIFVAYPYSFPKGDYRRAYNELAKAFSITFEFADERITNKQILDKITDMIMTSRFSLFDVTTWNANVALELGIAIGAGRDYYLLFNPSHPENPKGREVPADLGGLDRIQWHSYTELEEGLTNLLVQEFGVPFEQVEEDPLRELRERLPIVLERNPGLRVGEIAEQLGVPVEVAKVVVKPFVGDLLETTGAKKGTRYYLKGQAPPPRSRSGRR